VTRPWLARRCTAEALGTALLVAAVVGSGIMAQSLAGGNGALALLCNTIATAAALGALIVTFAPISGAHFNPAVTLAAVLRRECGGMDAGAYLVSQVAGGLLGTALANMMFGLDAVTLSTHVRAGWPQGLSEVVATFGLIATIVSTSRHRPHATAAAVAAYIAGAYWFTASTAFANPAVTIARTLTNTFAGIRPADAPLFVVSEIVGMAAAVAVCSWLLPAAPHGARVRAVRSTTVLEG
jgi:glycerol uptake facilitator-like aquaporin